MMFLLGIPLYIGICVFDVAMEKHTGIRLP